MATEINHVEVLRRHLESEVKKTITERLVKDQLNAYEIHLRAIIRGIVDKISFEHIDKSLNVMEAREEYSLWIKWNDEERKLIKGE